MDKIAEYYYRKGIYEGLSQGRADALKILEESMKRKADPVIVIKQQEQQMLKDAYVESQIVEDGRIELEGDPLPCLNPIILLPYPQFKPDDKVRIVVLKEEE